MPVQMIQSDVSRSNVYRDALKGFASPVPSITGGAGRLDSYKRVDPSVAKFVVQPIRYAMRFVPQVSTAKPPSYQTVSKRLASRKGILLSAYKRNLMKKGAAVVPALVKALKHKNKVVRSGSADVLGRIFRRSGRSKTWKGIVCRLIVMPKLTAALKDRDASVRKAAKEALSNIQKNNRPKANIDGLEGL